MLLDMLEKACVMAVVAYLLVRTRTIGELLAGAGSLSRQMVLGLVFVGLSLYGAANGLLVNGNLVALIHSGGILAGLLGGPVLGTAVGLIIAVIRFSMGGDSLLMSSLAALAAGVLPGLYHRWRGGVAVTVSEASAIAAGFELLARLLPLAVASDLSAAVRVQSAIVLPMLLGNATMVAIFVFVINTLIRERRDRAIRERLANELQLARELQLSLVPKDFAALTVSRKLAVYGLLEPAWEVGGDIYDCFFLAENRLCFMIGDVSGKGMPAALFMAATRTLFKAQADRETDTAEILNRVNAGLCRGNEATMFVTLFCGILDLDSGELVYSNAGHNPPYLRRGHGELRAMSERHGPALGVLEGVSYGAGRTRLADGDLLFLYTDGVTEAVNASGEMFTTLPLERLLGAGGGLQPQTAAEAVMGQVKLFAGAVPQADDITLLAVAYRGQ